MCGSMQCPTSSEEEGGGERGEEEGGGGGEKVGEREREGGGRSKFILFGVETSQQCCSLNNLLLVRV